MSLQYQWISACKCVCVCVCVSVCKCVLCVCVLPMASTCILQLTLIQVRYVQAPLILPQVLNAPPESVDVLSTGGTHFLKVTLGHLCQALPCKYDGSIELNEACRSNLHPPGGNVDATKTKIHEYKRNINTHTQ